MKKQISFLFLLAALFAPAAKAETAGENVVEAQPALARPSPNGGLSFGGADLFVAAFAPGWKVLPVKADPSPPGEGPRPVEIRGEQTFFRGTTEWRPQADGTILGRVELECVAPVEMQCVAVAANIPAPPPCGLGDDSAAAFDLPLADGRTARLSFPQSVDYHAQDSRPWGGAPLVEAGAADVALRLGGGRGAEPPSVFSLDTAGRRTGAVPSRFEDGVLRFRVSTRGPDGGRIYYEIVRRP